MWHEARRQERKIRGMLVDYRRRAERRRDFYEKIKADPTQFLQLHGRPCKVHLDPTVAAAADSPATMMPWQGQADNLIDRFDVRAHLDFIPPVRNADEDNPCYEERQCNYERYRILAQNVFLGISEDKFLKQLHLEEQFGYTADGDKEKKRKAGAAIGFNYDDPTNSAGKEMMKTEPSSSDEESDSDLDVDLCIDVSKVEQSQAHEMNKCGQQFGMCSNDFYSFLTNDMEEAENIRLAREEEHEKALFSGRKSRRERRAHREKRLANRVLSPPSYAARESPTYAAFRESKSRSRSPSPVNTGQITYITSFGDDEEPAASTSARSSYADKVKYGKRKVSVSSADVPSLSSRKYRRRSRSKSRSRSPARPSYRYHRRNRHTSSRSANRSRNRSYSYSRSPRRRSTSRSRNRRTRRSRSISTCSSSTGQSTRSRSRSRSRSKSSSSSSVASKSPKIGPKIARSKSRSRSRSRSRSKSRSVSIKKEEPPKPIQRYYGRRVSDKSSSELEDSPDEEVKLPANNPATTENLSKFGNSGSALKSSGTCSKLTPQERLKRKMQLLLNKQYKADKIAEQIRTERAQQEQRNREDELREMALKLRRKQRERRHAYDENNTNSNNSSDSDSSSSRERTAESRSKRSPSPSPSPVASPRRRATRDDEDKKEEAPKIKNKDDKPKFREDDKDKDKGRNRDRDERIVITKKDDKDKDKEKEKEKNRSRDDDRRRRNEYRHYRERERDRDRDRDRDREKNSPSPNKDYDEAKRKNRSLVDY